MANTGEDRGNTSQPRTEDDTSPAKYPGTVVAATLDPKFWGAPGGFAGVYATHTSTSPLIDYTLLDNCGTTHLVNDISRLVPGSFVSYDKEAVIYGTIQLDVIGRGRRLIKQVLNGEKGPSTDDLILEDVAIIDGFHVNIISEKLLRKKGL